MDLTICKTPSCSLYAIPGEKYCRSCEGRQVSVKEKSGFKSQVELFQYCWNNRIHHCYVTNQKLDKFQETSMFSSIFAHVLRKSAFPQWRLNPNNVVLLTPSYKSYSVHRIFDDGVYEEVLKFEKLSGHSFRILFELERKLHQLYQDETKKSLPERQIVKRYLKRQPLQ